MRSFLLTILFIFVSISIFSKDLYILKFKKFSKQSIEKYKDNYNFKKLFTLSDDKLLKLKLNGEKNIKKSLPDLRNYYQAYLTKEQFLTLKNDKNFLNIYKKPTKKARPVDIDPITPLFVNDQGYLYSFEQHGGTNSVYGWEFTGGKGENVTVVDIEYGWALAHEDLDVAQDAILYSVDGDNLTGTFPTDDPDHGTAVLGEIVAIDNDYGVTGMANLSTIKVVSDYYYDQNLGYWNYSVADAIIRATSGINSGDVILLEAQIDGPNYVENSEGSQFGLVPVEWYDAEFDAILTATANDIIVVEAAGNGEQNLDGAEYSTCTGNSNNGGNQPCFSYETRDSGAIIVGAGNPPSGNYGTPMSITYFTNYGSRVDVQAWGLEIVTTGYTDLFYPNNDILQGYTSSFGGTSGASPIITAAAAQIQGRYMELNNYTHLTPVEMRAILKDPLNSHPQAGTEHIGPMPDIKLIFENQFDDNSLCDNIICEEWERCSVGECVLDAGRCIEDSDCTSESCDVETHTCNPEDVCASVNCSEYYPNSHCVEYEGQAYCDCDDGYIWNNDQTACIEGQVNVCDGVDCTEYYPNSHCVEYQGQAYCDCDDGYIWNDDQTACIEDVVIDPCEGVTCSDHGTCVVQNDEAVCSCDDGYHAEGLSCVEDVVIDPCEGVTCSDHGSCVVQNDEAVCSCDDGYHAEGLSCVENSVTDPCEGVTCSDHGTCVVQNDEAVCSCDDGYHAEGLSCVENSVTDPCEGVTCSDHGTCSVQNNSAVCTCDEGFEPSGLSCIPDIVEPTGSSSDSGCSYNNNGGNGAIFILLFGAIFIFITRKLKHLI